MKIKPLIQQFQPLAYFDVITFIDLPFLEIYFPDLVEEALFLEAPFKDFPTVCSQGINAGYLTEIVTPVKGIRHIKVHPFLKQQCLNSLNIKEETLQIECFFYFIEHQYRIIYLLNEWINQQEWQQVQMAKEVIALEEENLRYYFDITLKDNQSFLGALGLLNTYYQLTDQIGLRKKLLGKVLAHFQTISTEQYEQEIYEEYRQALLFVGDTFFDDRYFEAALQQYQTALTLFGQTKANDKEWVLFLSCQRRIASTQYELRNFEKAETILLEVAEKLAHLENAPLLVSVTQALATLYGERNRDFELAKSWLQKGMEQLERLVDLDRKVALQQALGNLYFQFDNYEGARQEWQSTLAYYIETANEKAQADIHNNLGALHFTLGDKLIAKKHYKQALKYYLPLEDDFLKAELLSNLGATAHNLDEIPEHQSYFRQALAIYEQQDNLLKLAQVYQGLGSMEESLANYQEAETFYNKALTLFREYEETDSVGELLHNLGQLHFVAKNYAKSEQYSIQALSIYEKIQDKSGIAEIYQNLGNLEYEKENDDLAKDYYEKALYIFIELNDAFLEAGVRWNLGSFYKNQEAYSAALTHFFAALTIFQTFQMENDIMEVANEIAEIQLALKQPTEAIKYFKLALMSSQNMGEETHTDFFKEKIEGISNKNK